MTISIADLPVVDDLNVPMDPDEYVDQANPAPLKPGNYRIVVTKSSVRTNKDGSYQLTDDKYPSIVLEQAKVVEPVDCERGFGLFQDVRFKPFVRKDSKGADTVASSLYDLIWAFDATTPVRDYEHAKELIHQHLETGTPFLVQIRWQGYDKKYVEAEFAKIGGKANAAKDIANAIYNKARLNTKNFTVNGVLLSSIEGPSGETIEARAEISRYFRSTTALGDGKGGTIALGAFKK